MKCPKCKGLMLKETFYPSQIGRAFDKYEGLRCTACGNIIDPVILQNRKPTLPVILSWTHNPDEISVLVNSKRYTYELPLYWIKKVEKIWKYAPWKAFNIVKTQGVLVRHHKAYHRSKGDNNNATSYQTDPTNP